MLVVKALVVLAALLPVCISAASAQEAAADKFVYIGSVPHEHMSVRALAFDPDDAFLWAQTAYGLTATRVSRFSIASGTETFSFALDAELAGPPVLFDMDTGSVVRADDGSVVHTDDGPVARRPYREPCGHRTVWNLYHDREPWGYK